MSKISTKEEITQVYLKYQKVLFATALSYVKSMDTAEELVADAIVTILEQMPAFNSEASCVCYLKQIVRHSAISRLRKRYAIEPHEDADIEAQLIKLNPQDHSYRDVEVQLLLHELLHEYPKEIREAFIAHVIDQETIPVLAAYYGMKTDSLRKQLGRMKRRIAATIPERDMEKFLFMLMLFS